MAAKNASTKNDATQMGHRGISPDEVDDELLDASFYKGADSVEERSSNRIVFAWENGLTIQLSRQQKGWAVGLDIIVDGNLWYSPIRATDEVKQFWSEVRDVAFRMEDDAEDRQRSKERIQEALESSRCAKDLT